MKHWLWIFNSRANRFSREGKIGLGLLGVSLCAYLIVYIPGQSDIRELRRNIDSLAAESSASARLAPATSFNQLAAFYRLFPGQQSAPDWMAKIYHAARHENLELNEGKYRAKHQRDSALTRYEITLPVTGTYRQIQHFLGAIMKNIPILALNGVTFERRKIGDSSVNAKIKLTLYLGKAS